ncbi:MAG: PepSY domain-containing protein [Candidatus Competibacter denitrificans]
MAILYARRPLALLLVLAALLPETSALAGRDQDEIRRLHQTKQILALDTIITNHRRQYPGGKLLEAELEFEEGRYVYEIKILGDDGAVREFEYDARSGELWHLKH